MYVFKIIYIYMLISRFYIIFRSSKDNIITKGIYCFFLVYKGIYIVYFFSYLLVRRMIKNNFSRK